MTLGSQVGSLTAGAAGTASFAVTTKNVADGTVGSLSWYSDAGGKSGASAPGGISASVTAISGNSAIVTMTVTSAATAGSFYFTVAEDSGISSVATLAVAQAASRSLSLGAQTGALSAGTAGSVSFAVKTSNIADGTAGIISWYSAADGSISASAPSGISASVSAVSGGAATVTMTATKDSVVGSYYFKLSEDSAVSAIASLLVASASSNASKWSVWADSDYITSKDPISLAYDESSDAATVTVSSVAGATSFWEMNAGYDEGTLNKGSYIVSFTAWTDGSPYPLTSTTQEFGGDYSSFGSSSLTLTNTPTAYSYSIQLPSDSPTQVTFQCALQSGVFHIKGLKLSTPAASTLTMPTDLAASYDSSIAKTTISFTKPSDAEYLYLYENTADDSSGATLLCAYNKSKSYWTSPTKKEAAPAFTVAGYSAAGDYYYWVSGQKSGEVESGKSASVKVNVSGSFSNYAYLPSNAWNMSIGDNWGFTSTATGADTPIFFYATAGSMLTFSCNGNNAATVGTKLYLAASSPSSYLVGSASAYDTAWMSSAKSLSIPASGYYLIDRYVMSMGSYGISLALSSSAKGLATLASPHATVLRTASGSQVEYYSR